MGLAVRVVDSRRAFAGRRLWRAFSWRVLGHRPPALQRYNRMLRAAIAEFRPSVLLATGLAPVTADALAHLKAAGVTRIAYLTDDPWNLAQRARWFLRALPNYDILFSTRHANLEQLRACASGHVEYLPFGFDPRLFFPEPLDELERAKLTCDVLFAGGADLDRLPYVGALIQAGFRVALYGDYWERFLEKSACARGHAEPVTLRKATTAANVTLCLVRRANRDGHVMRSFEAAAIGACMLVEDTAEHRAIFGADYETVVYFRSIAEMVRRLRELLADAAQRRRLAEAVRLRITTGKNTYADRLSRILQVGASIGCS